MGKVIRREDKSYYYVSGRRSVKIDNVVFIDGNGTEYRMGNCAHRFVDLDMSGIAHYADNNEFRIKVADNEIHDDGWYISKDFNGKTRRFWPVRIVRRLKDIRITPLVRKSKHECEDKCRVSGEGVDAIVNTDLISMDCVKRVGRYRISMSHSIRSVEGCGFNVGKAELSEVKNRLTGHNLVNFLSFDMADIKGCTSDDVINDNTIINSEDRHRITVDGEEGDEPCAIYYETYSDDHVYGLFKTAFREVFRENYSSVSEKHIKYLNLINSLIRDGVIKKM